MTNKFNVVFGMDGRIALLRDKLRVDYLYFPKKAGQFFNDGYKNIPIIGDDEFSFLEIEKLIFLDEKEKKNKILKNMKIDSSNMFNIEHILDERYISLEFLKKYGIKNFQDKNGNIISFKGTNKKCDFIIMLFGMKNCKINIGENFECTIKSQLLVKGDNCIVEIGSDVKFVGESVMVVGNGQKIIVGEKCLFARGVEIRAIVDHNIIDLKSGKHIEHSKDIILGEHVWVGLQVLLLSGTAIGNNSILGARSLYTKEIPANCIAAGVPAKVIREKITWEI